jgi:hypothetical protein
MMPQSNKAVESVARWRDKRPGGRRMGDWLLRPGLLVAILAAPAMGRRAGRRSKVVRGNDEMQENSACPVVGTDSA